MACDPRRGPVGLPSRGLPGGRASPDVGLRDVESSVFCYAVNVRVSFTKISSERHRFGVRRDDGSRETQELESRSYLLHDWVHLAIEAELPIADGFYGQLASGTPLAVLNDRSRPFPNAGGLALAELLVGPMQSLYAGRLATPAYVALAAERHPGLVDEAFVERVRERLRRLEGHWRATPYGGDMTIVWPLAASAASTSESGSR
jgi:hypothetical protein